MNVKLQMCHKVNMHGVVRWVMGHLSNSGKKGLIWRNQIRRVAFTENRFEEARVTTETSWEAVAPDQVRLAGSSAPVLTL